MINFDIEYSGGSNSEHSNVRKQDVHGHSQVFLGGRVVRVIFDTFCCMLLYLNKEEHECEGTFIVQIHRTKLINKK